MLTVAGGMLAEDSLLIPCSVCYAQGLIRRAARGPRWVLADLGHQDHSNSLIFSLLMAGEGFAHDCALRHSFRFNGLGAILIASYDI